jgi:hypothetical protein
MEEVYIIWLIAFLSGIATHWFFNASKVRDNNNDI